jgi:SAM-dependent methyltransferase
MSVTETREGERDYVLGTHDEEVERLGLQHRVWRPRAIAAWQRAGFTVGQTLMDLGCGPGHASIDMAEMVGPQGHIVAIDRSRRFLDSLAARAQGRGLANIETFELDLDEAALPVLEADGAWGRWVLAFLRHPRELLARVHGTLRPGGALVLHEYVHYETWRMAPRCPALEEFVGLVVESWHDSGGEPDVGLELPRWLETLGFEIQHLEPVVNVVRPSDYAWHWPRAFIESGMRRLVTLGKLGRDRAREMQRAIEAASAEPHTWMVLPTSLEIVARRR